VNQATARLRERGRARRRRSGHRRAPGPIEQMSGRGDRPLRTDKPTCASHELVELSGIFASTEVRAFAARGEGHRARRARPRPARLDALTDRPSLVRRASVVPVKDGGDAPHLESPLDGSSPTRTRRILDATTPLRATRAHRPDEYRSCCAGSGPCGGPRGARGREGPYRTLDRGVPAVRGLDAEGNRSRPPPFTMPHPEDLDLLETDPSPWRSQAYDSSSTLGAGLGSCGSTGRTSRAGSSPHSDLRG